MKVGLYSRVSTAEKGQNPEIQLKDLRQYALARGWTVYSEYIDFCSGSKDRRPELDRLLEDSRKRKVDGILVWRLDRLGRSLKHLIITLDELRQLGISFMSFSENIDFSTSTGQLLFHLLGSFAQFERSLIVERVKLGIENAKAKGKCVGRRSQITTELLRTVSNTRSRGLSLRQIAKELGVSKSFVHKALKILRSESLENKGTVNEKVAVH